MDLKKLLACLVVLCGFAQAQFLGYTSLQTTQQTAFTAQAANGSSGTFSNIGQSAHFFTICPSATFQGTISLNASQDGTFAAPASLVSATYNANNLTTTCRILQAGGYYPAVRATVSNYSAGSISAFYTGIAGPIPVNPTAANSTGPTTPVQCDTGVAQGIAASQSNSQILTIPAGSSAHLYICQVTVSFNGATTAGTVTLFAANGQGVCTGAGNTFVIFNVTANTPQLFQLTFPGGAQAGATLCASTGAVTAATEFSVSYAIF